MCGVGGYVGMSKSEFISDVRGAHGEQFDKYPVHLVSTGINLLFRMFIYASFWVIIELQWTEQPNHKLQCFFLNLPQMNWQSLHRI